MPVCLIYNKDSLPANTSASPINLPPSDRILHHSTDVVEESWHTAQCHVQVSVLLPRSVICLQLLELNILALYDRVEYGFFYSDLVEPKTFEHVWVGCIIFWLAGPVRRWAEGLVRM